MFSTEMLVFYYEIFKHKFKCSSFHTVFVFLNYKILFYNTNIKSYCRFETTNSISLIISFVIKIKDIFTFTWVRLQKKILEK